MRWFYGVMRKMFGKDLTPVKLQMRVPGIVWGSIAMEAGLRSGGCRCATFNWRRCEPHHEWAAPFEWTSILQLAERRG